MELMDKKSQVQRLKYYVTGNYTMGENCMRYLATVVINDPNKFMSTFKMNSPNNVCFTLLPFQNNCQIMTIS